MIRFIARNYGVTKQVQYKDQQIIIANDRAIETDDIKLAAVLQGLDAMHVTDRCPETPGSSLPPVVKTEKPEPPKEPEAVDASDEIQYSDMTVKELQVLAKDRQIKVSGLNKADLIETLMEYDEVRVPEEEIVV